MGTRSLTVIVDKRTSKEICVLYRQYDGDPEGHGKELAEFLLTGEVVNGFRGGEYAKVFNGINGLAARIVHHFDPTEGQFYLHPAGTRDRGEEYIYFVESETPSGYTTSPITMRVVGTYDRDAEFSGSPSRFLEWLDSRANQDDEE